MPRRMTDLRAASVHHDKAHALRGKKSQIFGKALAKVGLVHGVTAVFYDDCGWFHGISSIKVDNRDSQA
jgi:hypothetical protein